MAQPFEWATRRSRVGTGVGTVRPGCRKSDEKVPSPFPENPLGSTEARKSEYWGVETEGLIVASSNDNNLTRPVIF